MKLLTICCILVFTCILWTHSSLQSTFQEASEFPASGCTRITDVVSGYYITCSGRYHRMHRDREEDLGQTLTGETLMSTLELYCGSHDDVYRCLGEAVGRCSDQFQQEFYGYVAVSESVCNGSSARDDLWAKFGHLTINQTDPNWKECSHGQWGARSQCRRDALHRVAVKYGVEALFSVRTLHMDYADSIPMFKDFFTDYTSCFYAAAIRSGCDSQNALLFSYVILDLGAGPRVLGVNTTQILLDIGQADSNL